MLAAIAAAMSTDQAKICRDTMKTLSTPPWSVIIDASIGDQISFTDQNKFITYIDSARFINAPNSFQNTICHECSHLLGHQHHDGNICMDYILTINQNGAIFNDPYIILPLP